MYNCTKPEILFLVKQLKNGNTFLYTLLLRLRTFHPHASTFSGVSKWTSQTVYLIHYRVVSLSQRARRFSHFISGYEIVYLYDGVKT